MPQSYTAHATHLLLTFGSHLLICSLLLLDEWQAELFPHRHCLHHHLLCPNLHHTQRRTERGCKGHLLTHLLVHLLHPTPHPNHLYLGTFDLLQVVKPNPSIVVTIFEAIAQLLLILISFFF